jgi:hypothetical protein
MEPEEPAAREHHPRMVDRETAPGLARVAAGAWWRTNLWTANAAYRATRRLAQAARSGESAAALIDDARSEAVGAARRILGIADESANGSHPDRVGEAEPLRERWEDLVERSTEVTDDEDLHPAFADILGHLHPDEARILRLLATSGPQAAVDVRNWRPLGIGSHVVAPGLTMVGQHAGVLHVDRVPAYLANMFRLGLIWFSRDAVDELSPYQVLEAQPEVTEALRRAGRGTTVRRSIRLTPFGEQFCLACLPRGTAEFDAIAQHQSPVDAVPPPVELAEDE